MRVRLRPAHDPDTLAKPYAEPWDGALVWHVYEPAHSQRLVAAGRNVESQTGATDA